MTCKANGWSCPSCPDCKMETRAESWARLVRLNTAAGAKPAEEEDVASAEDTQIGDPGRASTMFTAEVALLEARLARYKEKRAELDAELDAISLAVAELRGRAALTPPTEGE